METDLKIILIVVTYRNLILQVVVQAFSFSSRS